MFPTRKAADLTWEPRALQQLRFSQVPSSIKTFKVCSQDEAPGAEELTTVVGLRLRRKKKKVHASVGFGTVFSPRERGRREGGAVRGGVHSSGPPPISPPLLGHSFELRLGSPRLLYWSLNCLVRLIFLKCLIVMTFFCSDFFSGFPLSEGQNPRDQLDFQSPS